MSLFHRMNFLQQHTRSALFSVVLLVTLILHTLGMAPLLAMQATPPPPSPTFQG
jgi:hypothetical protein